MVPMGAADWAGGSLDEAVADVAGGAAHDCQARMCAAELDSPGGRGRLAQAVVDDVLSDGADRDGFSSADCRGAECSQTWSLSPRATSTR